MAKKQSKRIRAALEKVDPNKTYLLATNAGAITIGRWKWDASQKHSGNASHEGDSANMMWVRPGGMRIHGFRGQLSSQAGRQLLAVDAAAAARQASGALGEVVE